MSSDVASDELLRSAMVAVAGFLLFLALLLFLPAWSVRFWEAWLYWLMFGAFCIACTLYFVRRDPALIRRRMRAGPAAESERSQQVIQAVAAMLGIALFVVPGLQRRWQGSSLPVPLVLVADAIALAGLLFVVRVFRANSWAASTIQVEEGQPVVRSGPYAWVRHPMYSGSVPFLLATPLALGSTWALVPAALLCAVIVVRLLEEERFLAAHLAGYDDYRRAVRFRLVPGLW